MTKEFHLGDVLSVIMGRFVSPRSVDGVNDILNFMTGEKLFRHQISRACKECKPYLLEQFPEFDTPKMQFAVGELIEMLNTPSGKTHPDKLVIGWLSSLVSGKYGVKCEEMLKVKPVPWGAYQIKNPVTEMVDMVGAEKVIVVAVYD